MALETFTPPIAPSPGTSTDRELKLLKAEFGDGYTQTTRQGLNHIRRKLSLKWDVLLPVQAEAVLDFLERHGGDTPFYYQPSDDPRIYKWTCETWSDERTEGGLRSVSAEFIQSFSLQT